MDDPTRERDFFRQQCQDLGQRLLRLQQELDVARRESRRNRLATILISRLGQLADSAVHLADVEERFLRVLIDTLVIDRACLFQNAGAGEYVVQHVLGFTPPTTTLSLPSAATPAIAFADLNTPRAPWLDGLRQYAQTPAVLWVHESSSGYAVLLANVMEDQHLHQPFTADDGRTLLSALEVFADVVRGKRAQQALSNQLEVEDLAIDISTSFINLPVAQVDSQIDDALRAIARLLDADHAYFGMGLTPNGAVSYVREWVGPGASPMRPVLSGIPHDLLSAHSRGKGNSSGSLRIPSLADLPAEFQPLRDMFSQVGVMSGIGVPIVGSDALLGFLGVFSHTQTREWPAEAVTLQQLAAEVFTSALKHKEAAIALAESEANYRQLVENVNCPIVRLDPQGDITFLNQYAERFFGYTTQELLGKNLAGSIAPIVDSEGRELAQLIHEIARRPEEYAYNENENMRRDGERVWMGWANRSIFDAEGNFVEVLCIGTDLTQRRKEEQLLQRSLTETLLLNRVIAAITSTLDPMAVLEIVCRELAQALDIPQAAFARLDPSGESLTVVAEYCAPGRPSGMGEVIPVTGNEFTLSVLQSGRPAVAENAMVDERTAASHDLFTRRGTASILVVPLVVQGQAVGTLGLDALEPRRFTADEITLVQNVAAATAQAWENSQLHAAVRQERENLAQRVAERTAELLAANEELAHAVRLKDEFLANMSHELRTPLNAVLGLSEALQEEVYGTLNDRQKKSLASIERSGRHLLDLINDILDISRIEADRVTLDKRAISVRSLCQASVDLVRPDAEKKHVDLSIHLDGQAATLSADERRLRQILVNLLSNAIKFTPDGGKVGLDVTVDPAAKVTRLTVWDTGIGIAAGDLERIFQPFVQLDASLSRHYSGTGLGLALAGRLARMHGGDITVESQPGEGSRFCVTIPW